MKLTSSAFDDGEEIPRRYSGEGKDVSPPLSWENVPDDAREFALVCEDPDAPGAEAWVHWVVYCIPGERTELPEGSAGGAFEGANSWDRTGYGGPMPPPGHGTHHYHFRLYALDATLDLPLGADKRALEKAMDEHVLDSAELVGTYER